MNLEQTCTSTAVPVAFNRVPHEIWLMILGELGPMDQATCSRVCRRLHQPSVELLYAHPNWHPPTSGPRSRSNTSDSWDIRQHTQQQQQQQEYPPTAPSSPVASISADDEEDVEERAKSFWEFIMDAIKGRRWSGGQKKVLTVSDRWKLFLRSLISSSSDTSYFDSLPSRKNLAGRSSSEVMDVVNASKLARIKLSNSPVVGGRFMGNLGQHVRVLDLRTLKDEDNITIGDNEVHIIAANCSNLLRLNLEGCKDITDTGMSYLASSRSTATLSSISLSKCVNISDATLLRLARTCSSLKSINLKECVKITDDGLVHLIEANPNLNRLRLFGCCNISNKTMIAIGEKCARLQWLDIGKCSRIGDAGLCAVASGCPNLQWLDISRSHSPLHQREQQEFVLALPDFETTSRGHSDEVISDIGVSAIAEHCRNLELLDVSFCDRLTDTALTSMHDHSHSLKSLSLKGLPLITREGMLKLADLRKDYRKLIWLQIFQCQNITTSVIDEMINRLNDGWRKGPYDGNVHKDVMNGKSWEDVGC